MWLSRDECARPSPRKVLVRIIGQDARDESSLSLTLPNTGAGHGVQESRVGLSSDAGRLEQQGHPAELPRRKLAAERIPGISVVPGTALMESYLAQYSLVGSGAP